MVKPTKMFVSKRGGRKEEVHFDKITSRIQKLCYGLNMDFVEPVSITMQVINGLYSGVTTQELDNLAAETAATMSTEHADYAVLAARIAVSNLHKETKKQFSDVMDDLFNANVLTDKKSILSEFHHKIIMDNADRLNSAIIYDRDFGYNYFGFKAIERSYLLKIDKKIVERPQHMLMRVAVGIHGEDIEDAIETYNLLSERYYMHSPQTMFLACNPFPQLSSSILLSMRDDSIDGIYDTLTDISLYSKYNADIGLNMHCIRAKGSYIAGTNGISNGLVPLLRVYNHQAEYIVHCDGSTSSIAIFIEPWHADIFEYINLKKMSGIEESRARTLNYAIWIPDLFMQRVESDSEWSLFCPHNCPGLFDSHGEKFETLYKMYETQNGKCARKVKARELWFAMFQAQIETGSLHMIYKDACNRKSNQQNLGTIKNSNFTTDMIQYCSKDESAICNFSTISLNMFVKADRSYDFVKLKEVAQKITINLNKIIDVNWSPEQETINSNKKHRPIAIGVQALADTFIQMRLPYESEEAATLNKQIFETIYYGALEASCELSKTFGPYETYENSPVSKGVLQYDMWNVNPSDLWNWTELKAKIAQHGIRNSLLLAAMPTTVASEILGVSQSFEPIHSNVYKKRMDAGDFYVINHHLINDLTELNLWDDDVKTEIIAGNGSIQNIDSIPGNIKELYKTAWEIKIKNTMNMAADRGAFIDQSQAFNIFVDEANYARWTSMHFYAWKLGLKCGIYNLKLKSTTSTDDSLRGGRLMANGTSSTPIKESNSTLKDNSIANASNVTANREQHLADMVCSLQNRDECISCGS